MGSNATGERGRPSGAWNVNDRRDVSMLHMRAGISFLSPEIEGTPRAFFLREWVGEKVQESRRESRGKQQSKAVKRWFLMG